MSVPSWNKAKSSPAPIVNLWLSLGSFTLPTSLASIYIALIVGDSDDLVIQHSSGHSYIDNHTGDLIIQNDATDKDVILKSDDGSDGMTAYLTLDGSAARLEAHKDIKFADSVDIHMGTHLDLKLYHDGSNSYIEQDGTGDLIIQQGTTDKDIILKSDDGSGGETAYITLDGSSTDLLLTPPGNVGIGETSPDSTLHINSGTGNIAATFESTDAGSYINILDNGSGAYGAMIGAISDDIVFSPNNVEKMRINSSGNVGIGTASPGAKFTVLKDGTQASSVSTTYQIQTVSNSNGGIAIQAGSSSKAYLVFGDNGDYDAGRIAYTNSSHDMAFYTNNTEEMILNSSGDLHVDQDVIAYSSTPSDIRLKKNFTKIENGLDIVSQLEGHTFNWKKGGDRLSAGFKAQEVEKILPHLVDEKKLPLKADDDKEYKILRYEEMIPYLVEAIKEQQEEIDLLKANYDQLKYNRR